MDILSKDTLALIDNENVRKALNDLLTQKAGATSEVRVPAAASKTEPSDHESESTQVVTLRRLSI